MRDSPLAVLSDATGAFIASQSDGTNNRLAVDARVTGSSGLQASVVADGAVRRLSVDVRGSGTAATQNVISYLTTSGGSNAIHNANGSLASPVNFFYSPPAGRTATITRVAILFEGTGFLQNGSSFIGTAPLTNGVAVGATVGGASNIFSTLKINEDIILQSNGATAGSASGGTLLGINLGTVTFYQAVYPIAQPLLAGEQINVWVRDNLNATGNGLLFARASVQGYLTS